MSNTNDDLGGRISLSEPTALTAGQQSLRKRAFATNKGT
jgi:hypothetical protein